MNGNAKNARLLNRNFENEQSLSDSDDENGKRIF